MTEHVTSNLSALSEVVRCLAITSDAGITSKLCRFLEAPTQRILDELEQDLWMVCDSLAIDEFIEWGDGVVDIKIVDNINIHGII